MTFFTIVPLLTLLAVVFVIVPAMRGNKDSSRVRCGQAGLVLGLAGLIVIPSIALYYFVGRPDLAAASVPTQARADVPDAAQSPSANVETMIAALKAKTQRAPNDPAAWQNLGWAYMHISRPADAALAYGRAVALAPADGDYLSSLTEASVQSGDGRISKSADADFGRVLSLTPGDPRARFYRALYKDQQGDHKGAVADWIRMLKSAPQDAPWADEVRAVVQKVAQEQRIDVSAELPPATPPVFADMSAAPPGPDAGQVAAAQAMSPTDRAAMIHGMVDGLATRLKQNPQDADGWMRLIRARMVLGERGQAQTDYRKARRTFANTPAVLTALNNAAQAAGVTGP
jgi:cytochrome c-type biogenesis protein CcmH